MTAVEWLVSELRKPHADKFITHIIHKALEMEREQRLEMLINFQVFLNENDYITDTDWDWEHMAIKFLNSKNMTYKPSA